MINWWPITRSRLEDPKYQALTPRERLYVEYVISRYSHQGHFYQSDLEVAVTLGVSEITLRCARRKVGTPTDSARKQATRSHGAQLKSGLGWIVYEPGWEHGTKKLATQYVDVPIATVEKGDYFTPVSRFTFEQLLARVRRKQLTHADVVVWLVLSYKHGQCRGANEEHSFFITKRELVELSGVSDPTASIQRLYEQIYWTNGDHLFEYSDECQRLDFSEWIWFADPTEEERNAHVQEETRREIAAGVAKAKKKLAQKQMVGRKGNTASTDKNVVVTSDGKIRHLTFATDEQYQDDADWETTDGKNFYVSEAARERTDRQTEMEWKRQQDEQDAKRKRQQLEAARKCRAKGVSQTQKPLPGQNTAFDDKIRAHGKVYHVTDPQMSYDHVHIDDSSSWETTDGKNYYLTEAVKNRDAEWRRKFIERQVKYLRLEQEEARDEQEVAGQKGAT